MTITTGIVFPVFIALLPVVRHVLGKYFVDERFCELLDPEELPEVSCPKNDDATYCALMECSSKQ